MRQAARQAHEAREHRGDTAVGEGVAGVPRGVPRREDERVVRVGRPHIRRRHACSPYRGDESEVVSWEWRFFPVEPEKSEQRKEAKRGSIIILMAAGRTRTQESR